MACIFIVLVIDCFIADAEFPVRKTYKEIPERYRGNLGQLLSDYQRQYITQEAFDQILVLYLIERADESIYIPLAEADSLDLFKVHKVNHEKLKERKYKFYDMQQQIQKR